MVHNSILGTTSSSLFDKGIKELQEIDESLNKKADDDKRKQNVCIYWLAGNCKKSDDTCDFLHSRVEEKISICKYFKETGFCSKGDDCLFRHVLQDASKRPATRGNEACPYYDRGFCIRGGAACKFKHSPNKSNLVLMPHNLMYSMYAVPSQRICINYVAGFCPLGPECIYKHIKSVIGSETLSSLANFPPN
jgi:cleavage and polyadenylation specificity factor subunit 4